MLHTVLLTTAKLLHVALGPMRLLRDGEIEVGDISLLYKRMTPARAFLRYDNHGAKA